MNTGENEQGLRKTLDWTRMIGVLLLLLHFYYYCFNAFERWGLEWGFFNHLLGNFSKTGLFGRFHTSKLWALLFLLVSLIGARGKKDETLDYRKPLRIVLVGIFLYFGSACVFYLSDDIEFEAVLYMLFTSAGFICILTAGNFLSRIIRVKLHHKDVFNRENETFPQEERLLENEYSVNLPARYWLKGEQRNSWINYVNLFRGLIVMGSPGSGKTRWVISNIIRQNLAKGFCEFVYDFKYPDLSLITYNHFLKNRNKYPKNTKFCLINFDDLTRSFRCNPLHPDGMLDITDALESARAVLLDLNREWIRKSGDFWVESSISFLTSIIWFLRRYKDGKYCTLPHAIELMQISYDKLLPVLGTEPEVTTYLGAFVSAYATNTTEQLEGQVGGTKIAIARLSSPTLYYVLTGNDCTLDINNPLEPKILCLANNPQKKDVYGPVLSLYVARMIKLINKPGMRKSSLIFEEFPSIFVNGIDSLIATARSQLVATTICVQDFSQLKKEYSRDQAEVILNICGNIISGQISGETAKFLSDKFGRIIQNRESLSINSNDTSVSKSFQLETAIPASKISSLSSGEFVGMTADDPNQKIQLKFFHSEIIDDAKALEAEKAAYRDIPVVRKIDDEAIQRNYVQIKEDVQEIIASVMDRIINDPSLHHLIVRKGGRG